VPKPAPDEHPDMRLKSADQSMITDVSRLRPHLCTIITSTASTQIVGEDTEPRIRRLTRDIRAKRGRGRQMWLASGKAQKEQMFSGLAPATDIQQCDCYFGSGPKGEWESRLPTPAPTADTPR
jgi:hypothetical protein